MRTDLSLERGRFASVLPNAAQRFSENECSDRQKSFQKVEDERIRASCNFRKVCVGNISLIMIEWFFELKIASCAFPCHLITLTYLRFSKINGHLKVSAFFNVFHILRHAKFQELSTYWCISLKFLFRNSYKLW